MLLSAALIVRDEAAHLPACLASLDGLVDEVVVVDTGSTDGTVEVARSHGAVVDELPWAGDFALARNRSLDLATGEWVLYVDADERVRPGAHDAVRAWLREATGCVAARVRFVPRVGWTPYREFRLWRNRADIRFTGSMHETVVPAIAAVAEAEALRIADLDELTVDHLGYEGDPAWKRDRDEPLLRAELARRPDRAYLYDHLARVHEGRGDADAAVATWRDGIAMTRARPGGRVEPDDVLLYVNLVMHRLAAGYADAEVGSLLAEALDRYGRLPTLELAAARYELATGAPEEAGERARWLLGLDLEAIVETGSSFDGRVFGEWAWEVLGSSRFALGDDGGAAEAYGRAEALAPTNPVHGVRRRLAEARAAAGTTADRR